MSKSKDKQRRKNSGLNAGYNPDAEAEQARRNQTKKAVIVLALFAVVGLIVLGLNSNLFYRNVTAVTVEDQRFSVADMNFYYANSFNFDAAVEAARRSTVLHNRAVEEGLTLDEDARSMVDGIIDTVTNEYTELGFRSTSQLLSTHYSSRMNVRILRERMEFDALGRMYEDLFMERQRDSFTEDMLEAFYTEHRDNYDQLTFRAFEIPFFLGEIDFTTDEAALADIPLNTLAEAHMSADAIVSITEELGEEGFLLAVLDAMGEHGMEEGVDADFNTMQRNVARGTVMAAAYGEWLTDESREYGDVTVIEGESSVFVLYFIDLNENRFHTSNVRHILIGLDNSLFFDDDGEPLTLTDEDIDRLETQQRAEALEQAEDVLAQWRAGEATEDSFIELVREYSADNWQNNESPGLFEVHEGSDFVDEFEDWAIDPARAPGDVDIVETQFGYHIMYFVGESELERRHSIVQRDMANEAFQTWLEDAIEESTWRTTFFSRLVGFINPTQMW